MVKNLVMSKNFINYLFIKGYLRQTQLAYVMFIHGAINKPLEEILTAEKIINPQDLLLEFLGYELTHERVENLKPTKLNRMDEFIQYKFIFCENEKGENFIVAKNLNFKLLRHLMENSHAPSCKIILKDDFDKFFEDRVRKYCLLKAIMQHEFTSPYSSVKKLKFIKILISIFLGFSALFIFNPYLFYIVLFSCLIISTLFKIILFALSFANNKQVAPSFIEDFIYPIYSILIPLYNEPFKINTIIKAMERIDYPKCKLEVKLLIEADDDITLRAIAISDMPEYIRVIKIPPSSPRTKPKALNYGLQFVTGKYVAIYDAEDVPEKMQLKKACHYFATLPEEYVCLQASLNFYNREENYLTRLFSLEYYIWFNFLLPGLDRASLPVPLGGTSNHFKVDFLKKFNGWDPYNVTEDAEIGIRLFSQGYKTKMINSITLEESLLDVKAWIYQRARWIKGFITTYFVYKYNLKSKTHKFPLLAQLSINIFLGLSVLNFIMFPLLCLAPLLIEYKGILLIFRDISIVLYVLYCYLTAAYAMINLQKRFFSFTIKDIVVIIGWPFYFTLHSFASWRAIYELLVIPYKWNKTEHGISKLEMNLDD
jgi:cellulose synthase/poly-beta-1,6-N-acetylglucosamine synthase-like glycosyltransferase